MSSCKSEGRKELVPLGNAIQINGLRSAAPFPIRTGLLFLCPAKWSSSSSLSSFLPCIVYIICRDPSEFYFDSRVRITSFGQIGVESTSRTHPILQTVLNELDVGVRFIRKSKTDKGVKSKGCVSNPSVSVIPLSTATNVLKVKQHFSTSVEQESRWLDSRSGRLKVGAATMAPVSSKTSILRVSALLLTLWGGHKT